MKSKFQLFLIVVSCSIASSVFSQDANDQQRLEKMFSKAMGEQGVEYGRIRGDIIACEGSESFLAGKSSSTNVFERIIGRAMLSWQQRPSTNIWYNEMITVYIDNMFRFQSAPDNIRYALYSRNSTFFDLKTNPSDIIALCEIAAKGVSTSQTPVFGGGSAYKQKYTRCLAAGLIGNYNDPDFAVFIEALLRESESDFLRACCIVGIGKTDYANRDVILLNGLADTSPIVREDANHMLKIIIGQDFKGNLEKYRAWFETNMINQAVSP